MVAMPPYRPFLFFSTPTPPPLKGRGRTARDTGRHEALTLCLKFSEHFIDPVVYLAGASQWITDSARN